MVPILWLAICRWMVYVYSTYMYVRKYLGFGNFAIFGGYCDVVVVVVVVNLEKWIEV